MIVAYIPEDIVQVWFTKEEAEYMRILLTKNDNRVLKRIYHKINNALESTDTKEEEGGS